MCGVTAENSEGGQKSWDHDKLKFGETVPISKNGSLVAIKSNK